MRHLLLWLCWLPIVTVAADRPVSARVVSPTELLRAGDTPQKTLRLNGSPKGTYRISIQIEQTIEEAVLGRKERTTMPRVRLDGTLQTIAVTEEHIAYDMVFESVQVRPTEGMEKGTDGGVRSRWTQVLPMTYHAKVGKRGALRAATLTLKKRAHPELQAPLESLKETLRSMHVDLPEEPVGPNAQWKVRRSATHDGIGMARTSNWTLNSLGPPVRFIGSFIDTAEPANVHLGDLPKDMSAQATSVGGQGSYEIQWQPGQVLPEVAYYSLSHYLHIAGTVRGRSFDSKTTVNSKVVFRLRSIPE